MVVENSLNIGFYAVQLINCALKGNIPKEIPENITIKELVDFAHAHNIDNLIFESLSKMNLNLEENETDRQAILKLKERSDKSIVKELSFNLEREKILLEMELSKINYLPLKGIVLKDYYPKPGMRYISDNDILYNKVHQKQLISIMKTLGYNVISLKDYHDIYKKPPIFNFEMHRELLLPNSPFYIFSETVWDRAIKDEDKSYGFHMSHEDFYIYMLIHLHKHYTGIGTGIRSLTDIYVYLDKLDNRLDWNYIEVELDKLNLKEFEADMRNITCHIFSEEKITERESEIFARIVAGGTYGKYKTFIQNNLSDEYNNNQSVSKAKLLYIKKRIFMNKDLLKQHYPFVYRHLYLYPLFIIYRLLFLVVKNYKRIIKELKTINEFTVDKKI
jgi:hypothetical protein